MLTEHDLNAKINLIKSHANGISGANLWYAQDLIKTIKIATESLEKHYNEKESLKLFGLKLNKDCKNDCFLKIREIICKSCYDNQL
jgi:hypothetical protein